MDREEFTAALVIVNSASPREAPIRTPNFSQTPSRMWRRLFSASVDRKFLTVPPLSAPPVCFSSSAVICDLSEVESVGAPRITVSLGSDLKICCSEAIALAVESSEEDFTAAVYCGSRCQLLMRRFICEVRWRSARNPRWQGIRSPASGSSVKPPKPSSSIQGIERLDISYQSACIGPIDTEELNWRLAICGCGCCVCSESCPGHCPSGGSEDWPGQS